MPRLTQSDDGVFVFDDGPDRRIFPEGDITQWWQGDTVALFLQDGFIRIHDLSGKVLLELEGYQRYFEYSPDGKHIAFLDSEQNLQIWNVQTGNLLLKTGYVNKPIKFRYSPDSEKIAYIDSNHNLKVLDFKSNRISTVFENSGSQIEMERYFLYFDDNRDLYSCGSTPHSSSFVDSRCGSTEDLMPSVYVYDFIFSPDSSRLLIGLQVYQGNFEEVGKVPFLGYETFVEKLILDLQGDVLVENLSEETPLSSFRFDKKGQFIANIDSGYLNLVDLQNGRELSRFDVSNFASEDDYFQLEFSNDNRSIIFSSEEDGVLLWNLHLDDLINKGCDLLDGYLRYNPTATDEDRALCGITLEN